MKRLIQIVILLVVVAAHSQSQTLIRVPQDQPTIQAGINAASDGDTVLVAEGTYPENIKVNKKITVGSLFIQDGDTSHISKTIIDGSGSANPDSGSTVTIGPLTDTTTVIVGLTITKGKGNLHIDASTGWRWLFGGGINVWSNSVKIVHNRIIGNTINTTGTNPYALGGGISTWYSISTQTFYIIEDNEISGNTISGSQAEAAGVSLTGNARFNNNIVKNNTAVAPAANFAAGGLAISGHPLNIITFSNNIISDNSSTRHGGGIVFYRPTGAGGPTVHLSNNLIVRNHAVRAGAGLFVMPGCNITLVNNTIADNVGAGGGAGLYISGTSTDHSIVVGINNIFWNSGNVNNEIFGADFESLHHNLIRGEHSFGENNFNADPKFMTDSTYRLNEESPCIAGGITQRTVSGMLLIAPSIDIKGSPRSQPDGTLPDIGAVESTLGTTSALRPNRTEVLKFLHNTITRYCIVIRPKGHEQESNQGLLINLHGYDGSADDFMNAVQLHKVGDSLGFISAYPEGYQRRWNSGIGDNVSWPTPPSDDVGFVSVLIDSLHARYGVDTNRVYVAGESNGGFMCLKLLSLLDRRIRGAAAVNAVISSSTAAALSAGRQVPVLLINGTSDATIPFYGGVSGWYSASQTLEFWRTRNNATFSADTLFFPNIDATDNSTVERYRYHDSAGRRMVWFYRVFGGVHMWPGGPTYPGAPFTNRDIDANWEIFDFIGGTLTSTPAMIHELPQSFSLLQNYPNPFNPSTVISYQLSAVSNVRLSIYDVLGREVTTLVNKEQLAGVYTAEWNASVASGVYFYRLEAVGRDGKGFVETRKMMLVK